MRGLLSRVKAIRMLKLIVWFCVLTINISCVAGIVLVCTVCLDADRADAIVRILTVMAGVDGGELLLSASVRLWGKDNKEE